ncbi:glycoside hydrolase [Dendrothele bispora CBS 962.96]|uniref:Glycoside hydrolase n=1 Tax=Dendrothele bispora (strain CBS 962.96) TaxID=1314807 RepID=A0A4S8MAX7_DENBC|nr:glycoside hydrolase [Dendrothele bispora CBS 962.96]
MGRYIYGGIYGPDNKHGLSDPKTGFRKDVLALSKNSTFLSSDILVVILLVAIDGKMVSDLSTFSLAELAWLTEESNQFGTDKFMEFCKVMGAEPYICLKMGAGTLEDTLAWLDYCNRCTVFSKCAEAIFLIVSKSANTHYANLQREIGHPEPYRVKYWSLGNEVWGAWQAHYYSVRYDSETGYALWDRVTLKKLVPVFTLSEGDHSVNVIGRATAEKAIDITTSLIDLAKIESGLDKKVTLCFHVRRWPTSRQLYEDPVRAPGEKEAEEHYNLSDAIVKPTDQITDRIHTIFTTTTLRMNTFSHDAAPGNLRVDLACPNFIVSNNTNT